MTRINQRWLSEKLNGFGEGAGSTDEGDGTVTPHSLIGSLYEVPTVEGTCCFIIIIVCVLIIEYAFHVLDHSTQETSFHELVLAVQKELLIVGENKLSFVSNISNPSALT